MPLAGADAQDVRLLNHGGQGLLAAAAGCEKVREIAPPAELRDLEVHRAEPGLPIPQAMAIALGLAIRGAGVAVRPNAL